MNVLKKVNGFRKAVMKQITKNIGVTRLDERIDLASRVDIRKVLICRPNHRLGNLLLITPLLQEVTETFPQAKIDLFAKGSIALTLFENYDNINCIIQLPKKPVKAFLRYLRGWTTMLGNKYDLVINVVNNSSSGKLSTRFANSKYKFLGEINHDIRTRYPDHEHIAKYPVYSFRYFISKIGFPKSERPVPSVNLKLSSAELAEGKRALKNLMNNEKSTFCIYTYATGPKRHSEIWWEEFYERLTSEFRGHNILEILPMENVSQISFRAQSFYSKNLRQIGSLIANTELFIGADSGMMHLASASLVPTIGLFNAPNVNTYAPYNNDSLGVDTSNHSIDDCIDIVRGVLSKRFAARAVHNEKVLK